MIKEKVLHEFQKNVEEKVVTSFSIYKGRKVISLRVHYQDGDTWKPTTKGLTLRREMIPDLKEAVDIADAEYKKESPGSEEKE
jgi:hypothetical protein